MRCGAQLRAPRKGLCQAERLGRCRPAYYQNHPSPPQLSPHEHPSWDRRVALGIPPPFRHEFRNDQFLKSAPAVPAESVSFVNFVLDARSECVALRDLFGPPSIWICWTWWDDTLALRINRPGDALPSATRRSQEGSMPGRAARAM